MKNKKGEKRKQILNTALELFVNQGFQQTSMAQISKVSGVSVGTMYHHFKGKDELINDLFIEIEQNLGNAVRFSELERQLSIKNRFEILWRKAYNFYVENPNQFLFQHTVNYSPLISNETREIGRKNYEGALTYIQEAIEKEVFVAMDILVLSRWYYRCVVTLIEIKLANETEVTEQMIASAIHMTWRSLTRE